MLDWTELTVEQKLDKAKIQTYVDSPFFAYILLHLNIREDADHKIFPPNNRTMGVDPHGNLWYDKDWVNKLTLDELKSVLVHESCHLAFMHLERLGPRHKMVFNIANDICVNNTLVQSGFKLPKSGIIPQNNEFNNNGIVIKDIDQKPSEEIYDELMKYPQIQKMVQKIEIMLVNGKGNGKGMSQQEFDELMDELKGFDVHIYDARNEKGEAEGEAEKMSRQRHWKDVTASALQIAKQHGHVPAGFERMIENILASKMDWKEKLYKYVVATVPFDFSWSRSSRKFISQGIYMPSVLKESVKIVVSVDTSGSIGNEELGEFLGELLSIANAFVNINVDVIVCDSEVHETYELTKDNIEDIVSMKMSGGGGTSHEPVIRHILDNIQDARVHIGFTDGMSNINDIEHDNLPFDNLWCISKNGVKAEDISWGEVIKLE